MPNSGDFDPAKAIQGFRQQRDAEESKKRAAEEAAEQRRQAQEELRRTNLLKMLRYADEQFEEIHNPVVSKFVIDEGSSIEMVGFFRKRAIHRQHTTRYYGSWLLLYSMVSTPDDWGGHSYSRSGLVKLCQPHTGYALVETEERDWDPRNVVVWSGRCRRFTSLEEVAEGMPRRFRFPVYGDPTSLENLTKAAAQALDFVATEKVPDPTMSKI